eukprot:7210619-Lingulodinium_polyedra.AAC.1
MAVHGHSMANPGPFRGQSMATHGHPWQSMAKPWPIYGQSAANPWPIHSQSMANPWPTHGDSMANPWAPHG